MLLKSGTALKITIDYDPPEVNSLQRVNVKFCHFPTSNGLAKSVG